jgi:hypothetical protein
MIDAMSGSSLLLACVSCAIAVAIVLSLVALWLS